jgi:hypothetical protein
MAIILIFVDVTPSVLYLTIKEAFVFVTDAITTETS